MMKHKIVEIHNFSFAYPGGKESLKNINLSIEEGSQKQLLNLASIMAMHPWLLILDEPASQLDPIAASDFLETVKRINRDIGTTVILTEHRLQDVIPWADHVIVMDEGTILTEGTPREIGKKHSIVIAGACPETLPGKNTAEWKGYQKILRYRAVSWIPWHTAAEPSKYVCEKDCGRGFVCCHRRKKRETVCRISD